MWLLLVPLTLYLVDCHVDICYCCAIFPEKEEKKSRQQQHQQKWTEITSYVAEFSRTMWNSKCMLYKYVFFSTTIFRQKQVTATQNTTHLSMNKYKILCICYNFSRSRSQTFSLYFAIAMDFFVIFIFYFANARTFSFTRHVPEYLVSICSKNIKKIKKEE